MKQLIRGLKRRIVSSSQKLKRTLQKKLGSGKEMPSRIEVFMRHCYYSDASQHKKRPPFFDRQDCFTNFCQTIDDTRIHLTCILDAFHAKDTPHFVLEQDRFDVISISEGQEAKSFCTMLDIVEKKNFSPETILYFVEDDYVHQENWLEILLEGFSIPGVDYVTLYDHPDKYTELYQDLTAKVYCTKSCHWRQTPSTTNTYAMRAATLQKHKCIHREYSEGVAITKDHAKFCALRDCGAQLISPIPGFSTHLETGSESPCIDWEKILLKTKQKLSS